MLSLSGVSLYPLAKQPWEVKSQLLVTLTGGGSNRKCEYETHYAVAKLKEVSNWLINAVAATGCPPPPPAGQELTAWKHSLEDVAKFLHHTRKTHTHRNPPTHCHCYSWLFWIACCLFLVGMFANSRGREVRGEGGMTSPNRIWKGHCGYMFSVLLLPLLWK